ncbi:MAG: efflux RND transporter periplasmic adaptor subunit [Pseudobacteriovorax sp.]|nr:efflux RND transporter periplasmic adaptor subunit [Pseudobacteriovorax sp.]
MNRIFITVSIALIVQALGCSKPSETDTKKGATDATPAGVTQTDEEKLIPVKVSSIEARGYREFGTYVGQIMPVTEAELKTYLGGRVGKLYKDRGDKVKKGEKLCDIEGSKYQAILDSAKLSEKLASEKLARNKQHLEQGTASRTQVDRAQMEFLEAKQMHLVAQKNRDGAYCVSPISGVIVDRKIERFDETSPGQTTFFVADTSKMRVTVGIPETEIDGYRNGNVAFLTSDSVVGEPLEGRIKSIARRIDASRKTFLMDLLFDNSAQQLLSGTTARVKVLRYDKKDQIVIPTESIMVLADEKAVMVVVENKAQKRTVEIQSNNETESLIAGGLTIGDQLIIEGQMQAVNGSLVEIKP